MAQIIPYSVKEKLPRDLYYPVKCSELESCLLEFGTGDVFLHLHQGPWRVFGDTPREHLLPEGDFHLLELRFDPEQPYSPYDPPLWRDLEERRVVWSRVYAVPRGATNVSGLWREVFQTARVDALRRVARPDLWANRWKMRFLLRGPEQAVEVWLERWTGVRREDPQRWRLEVPLVGAGGGE